MVSISWYLSFGTRVVSSSPLFHLEIFSSVSLMVSFIKYHSRKKTESTCEYEAQSRFKKPCKIQTKVGELNGGWFSQTGQVSVCSATSVAS